MSKPLTIDELKALTPGDWVWVIDKYDQDIHSYRQIFRVEHTVLLFCDRSIASPYPYSDYGKKWLAYKNKEQAEKYKIKKANEEKRIKTCQIKILM